MTGPRNEAEDFAAYQHGGIEGVAGIPRERQISLARLLSSEVGRMDQRHPATAVVKRDAARLYELLNPEPVEAPPHERASAQQVIDQLKNDPAYSDATHVNHADVTARITRAYQVVNRGKPQP